MQPLASFSLNGTEYHISDENMDMETLKTLLKKVLNPKNTPALDKLCSPSIDNGDWFEGLLDKYTDSLATVNSQFLEDSDDDELLNSL